MTSQEANEAGGEGTRIEEEEDMRSEKELEAENLWEGSTLNLSDMELLEGFEQGGT